MSETIVIIGAGQAGGQAAETLRREGFEGRIVLVGDEPHIPYQRPPLSKKFMSGEMPLERVYFKPPEFFDAEKVELKLNANAAKIDRARKVVVLDDGEELTYDKLLIATGSRVRTIDIPGADLPGVHYLRSITDVEGIQKNFREGAKLVVVGGGYIGLEVAAVAVKRGIDVTVLEMADRVLQRVTSPEMSAFFEKVHGEEGVKIRVGTGVTAFEGDGKLEAVVTSTGEKLPADFAVVGIGILPNVELAAEAGLEVDNGIVVDETGRTSDPDIYAAGDCTSFHCGPVGRRIRLESVQNALDQAKAAAAAMAGVHKPYTEVPWFWSDQYNLKLQMAGLNQGYDQAIVRGNPDDRRFATFYLKDGVVIAVDAVNSPPDYMVGRELIAKGAKVPPEELADTGVSMKEIRQKYA
jgi:3-phenylpropionate/trans-cinnamate dioxygenase ferredoxin reductase subunit